MRIRCLAATLSLCLLVARASAVQKNWDLVLSNPHQVGPGGSFVFEGTISNLTGADLHMSNFGYSFFTLVGGGTLQAGYAQGLLDLNSTIGAAGYTGSLFTIDWAGVPDGSVGWGTFAIDMYSPGAPQSVTRTLDIKIGQPQSPVPEPAFWQLATLLGLGGLGLYRRRR
jgi:MYXO-CTERM domain-containing protein